MILQGHPSYDARTRKLVCALCLQYEGAVRAFRRVDEFDEHFERHSPGRDVAQALLSYDSYQRLARRKGWKP